MAAQGSLSTLEKPRRDLESQQTLASSAAPFGANGNPSGRIVCYDYFLKPKEHSCEFQRYMGPTHGKCRRLLVQEVNPGVGGRPITGGVKLAIRLAAELTYNKPTSVGEAFLWFGKWLFFVVVLFWPNCCPGRSSRYYPPYNSKYWGQLWASRSPREYELRKRQSREEKVDLGAHYPRRLMLFDDAQETWFPCEKDEILMRASYMAVSYRQRDFPEGPIREHFVQQVRMACLQEGFRAYWLDLECIAQDIELMNQDLYRIADVFRGATKTLVMLADFYQPQMGEPQRSEDQCFVDEQAAWKRWGDRVWTLPEALLSKSIIAKFGDGPIQPKTLRKVALLAYSSVDEEMAIINSFTSSKDALFRIERLALLKSAIFRRAGTAHLMAPGSLFGPYPAEKVYALAGFFEHRILPDRRESEMMAMARLSMANDVDRFAERMIALRPNRISPTACWYSDSDVYGSNLWDIEPEVQVAGVTPSTALVLDGCRVAAIRWKNFPTVEFETKGSLRRLFAAMLVRTSPYWLVIGVVFLSFGSFIGILFFIIGLVILLFGPKLITFATSGRVMNATPWLIGVKGVMHATDASARLYGGAIRRGNGPMLMYTATGSTCSVPSQGKFRQGDLELSEQTAQHEPHQEMYTLIDTVSNTIYHFSASRPPTVAVYVGREGGMGRFLLCSENCGSNELHKETVIRMPTYLKNRMYLSDWLAIGGLGDSDSHTTTSLKAGMQRMPAKRNRRGLLQIALVTTFLLAMSAVPTVGALAAA